MSFDKNMRYSVCLNTIIIELGNLSLSSGFIYNWRLKLSICLYSSLAKPAFIKVIGDCILIDRLAKRF